MEASSHGRLEICRAVKTVGDAKSSVWQHSRAFADAFTDFCACIGNILRLQAPGGGCHPVASDFAVELLVADTILTTEMDELIPLFEAADAAFVDDYTAARSMEIADEIVSQPSVTMTRLG